MDKLQRADRDFLMRRWRSMGRARASAAGVNRAATRSTVQTSCNRPARLAVEEASTGASSLCGRVPCRRLVLKPNDGSLSQVKPRPCVGVLLSDWFSADSNVRT